MRELLEKRGRPPGRQFPARLVIPCTVAFKRSLTDVAKQAGEPAAAWARQAIQDRLDGIARVAIGDAEYTGPANYDY